MSSKIEKQNLSAENESQPSKKLTRKQFESELKKLQTELVKLQAWVVQEGLGSSSFLKAVTPLAKVVLLSVSPNVSALVFSR